MAAAAPDAVLDCVGLFCPVPVLEVRAALAPLAIGQTLEVLADDPASEADLRRWSARAGHDLMAIEKHGAVFRFLIRKTR
jgi:TusA-related sulfurtransferase